MPRGPGGWDGERARGAVWDAGVDSFGHVGSRLLWDALGVPEPPAEFCGRARGRIEDAASAGGAPAQHAESAGHRHRRVFAYAEYDLEPPPGEPEIRGSMLFENGFRALRAGQRWLQHTPLPINSWVDRSLCSEAQMMAAFCSQLKQEGLADADNTELNSMLHGSLYVYTSAPPCMSCVGVLWQFRLLFRGVELRFSSGSGRGLDAWMKQ
mmetsp:Transcript_82442/g.233828  ORF Transcript_82442/g.233828 Transcript_82442/m.233828 type:complete len:210 (+) Transcript_82442:277-906(+)